MRAAPSASLFRSLTRLACSVSCVKDTVGVEICGALKNVVALAAGFCDGLGYGTNTKAAIIRLGMMEMKRFAHTFFHDIKDETFWDSAGMADLITTCFGGRNRKCAEAFVKTGKPFAKLEEEMLNGQKLQGTLTARDVFEFLKARKMTVRGASGVRSGRARLTRRRRRASSRSTRPCTA